MRTIYFPVDGGPRLPLAASLLELKRLGVWKHPVRNRRIARFAQDFARQDLSWLREQMQEQLVAENLPATCKILVLVDSVEHALTLAHLLPGWPLVVGDGVIEDGMDTGQRQLLAERQMIRPAPLAQYSPRSPVWPGPGPGPEHGGRAGSGVLDALAAATHQPVDLPPRAGPRPAACGLP